MDQGRPQVQVVNVGAQASAASPSAPAAQANAPAASSSRGLAPVRVVLQQPALVRYRVPVFRELASRPGIELKVEYAEYPGLPNVKPEGFAGEFVPLRQFFVAGQELTWHSAQWRNATRRKADVLILSWSSRYISLIPTLLRAKLAGVKTVVWGHGVSKRESRLSFAFRAGLAKLATCVVFYNHTNAGRFVEQGFDRSRVFVALNCLDQTGIRQAKAAWQDDPRKLQEFRDQKGLGNGPIVLFVSRLDPNNRVDLLIEAAAIMARQRDDLRVVIVGSGEDSDRLKQLIADRGLGRHVMMVGAVYNEMELAPYYLSADVYCYPRNIGLSVLHAFGYGLPVVTSDDMTTHNPEIEAIRPGENGLMYKDGDAASLAATLQRLIDDPALAQKMAAEALRTVDERFTLKNMVDGFEAAIRYCVAQRR